MRRTNTAEILISLAAVFVVIPAVVYFGLPLWIIAMFSAFFAGMQTEFALERRYGCNKGNNNSRN